MRMTIYEMRMRRFDTPSFSIEILCLPFVSPLLFSKNNFESINSLCHCYILIVSSTKLIIYLENREIFN